MIVASLVTGQAAAAAPVDTDPGPLFLPAAAPARATEASPQTIRERFVKIDRAALRERV